MGKETAAWFVAALLLLLSVLMCFHLLSLWVSVAVCKDYAEALIQRVMASPDYRIQDAQNSCTTLEATLGEAVDKYLSVILSLIGGAAVSGGYATAVAPIPPNRKDDEP